VSCHVLQAYTFIIEVFDPQQYKTSGNFILGFEVLFLLGSVYSNESELASEGRIAFTIISGLAYYSNLKTVALCSSETSVVSELEPCPNMVNSSSSSSSRIVVYLKFVGYSPKMSIIAMFVIVDLHTNIPNRICTHSNALSPGNFKCLALFH
jgi:hypothetical protein